jgi:hypothetical protein
MHKNEMDKTCRTDERSTKEHKPLVENIIGRYYLRDMLVDVRMILKWILEKLVVNCTELAYI